MYDSIMSAVKKISKETGIRMVIPSGTAVQNARATILKDTMTRDGFHLHKLYGRYVAACTWFETIFRRSVVGNAYKPEGMSAEQCLAAQKSAHMAVKRRIRCKSMCSSHPILQHAAQSRQSEPFGVARAACVELSASVYADNGAVLTDCNNKLKTSSTTGEIYRLRQLRRARCGELNP